MKTLPRRLLITAVAAGVALTAGSAMAAPGVARHAVDIHKAGSSTSAVVDTLTKKERVIVISCGARWCLIHHIGPDGYVPRGELYNPYYGSKVFFQFPPPTPDPGRTHTPGR